MLIRALAHEKSPSARIIPLCESKRIRLQLDRQVMGEYRRVLAYSELREQYPQISESAVELVLRRLRYISDYFPPSRARFRFDRDPRDERFLELAIKSRATHLVTHDLDLLSLATAHTEAAKRLRRHVPQIQILEAKAFIAAWAGLRN